MPHVSPYESRASGLRIGLLGTARISSLSIIEPARHTGARLVAVAARDQDRAAAWARDNGVERVVGSYAELIADPEVDVIYNPLPNSLHAPWNLAAIGAGKHVLTEKPFAANADEARLVQSAAEQSDRVVFEGFHYRYHPLFERALTVITDGTIGELTALEVRMEMPAPPPDDLRWSWDLAGGALMDLGCYGVHVVRSVATALGGTPVITSATVRERVGADRVDEYGEAAFELPGGATATAVASMVGPWRFSMAATGTRGRLEVPNLLHLHREDRLLLSTATGDSVEHHGTTSTYVYQLEALAAAVLDGKPYPTTPADSVATMDLVDAWYRAGGFPPRPSYVLVDTQERS